jgi:hypothetical protein
MLILIVLVLVLLELTEQLHAKCCCSFCNHRYGFICVAGQVVSMLFGLSVWSREG